MLCLHLNGGIRGFGSATSLKRFDVLPSSCWRIRFWSGITCLSMAFRVLDIVVSIIKGWNQSIISWLIVFSREMFGIWLQRNYTSTRGGRVRLWKVVLVSGYSERTVGRNSHFLLHGRPGKTCVISYSKTNLFLTRGLPSKQGVGSLNPDLQFVWCEACRICTLFSDILFPIFQGSGVSVHTGQLVA